MGSTLDRNVVYKTFAEEAVTVDATAGGVQLTDATFRPVLADDMGVVTEARVATIKNVGADIRVTLDGTTTVTASVGFLVPDGGSIEVWGIDDIANLRAIRTGAVSSIITAMYARAH